MASARKLEAALAEISALRAEPRAPAALRRLRAALAHDSSHAAARAAEIAGEGELEELAPALAQAFTRFLRHPVKSDPGCRAKEAIADALGRMGCPQEELFLVGIRHVQMEPVWGGRADTASGLRGACARGLLQTSHPSALVEATQLLADPELPARIAAARALGHSGGLHAVPGLRLKVLAGDPEASVTSECLSALLAIDPQDSLEFAAGLLASPQRRLQEAAALALGASRLPGALAPLRAAWEACVDPNLSRVLLTAIASMRSDESLAFLLGVVGTQPGPLAREAIDALAIFRDDEHLAARVRATASARRDLDLGAALREAFGAAR
jgi:HEAT repeat protein